ncbi:Hypothetical protein IALB_1835 [Ignavibacterium album JCM 16511]|uniref:5'-Nucleotidase domain protein n=1 Tax=Ignavibacterium album (strain DSM 19864 / JCM 16511 / NBRC 101810 / Mat9-16) TaxID=945713 RepID=I0AKN5_IGNAJ|nr:choice-of-anchor J domain-containing protein [Ignavibacterium album]AFH49542.1 Hypothetical protein IALB_1835 [Ignavibacterium album JCM 16511]
MRKTKFVVSFFLLIILLLSTNLYSQNAETVETQSLTEKPNKIPINITPQIPVLYPELLELYDNGPIITNAGGGPGGSDGSVLQNTSLGLNVLGFNWARNSSVFIADNFTVPDGANWTVDSVRFYGYQTGSTTTSTFTGLYISIYRGNPAYGLTPVYGDTTTNRLLRTYWTGAYRYAENNVGTTRPIMAVVGSTTGLNLPSGEYWIMVSATGSLTSGPWMPPISILEEPNTGDALQKISGIWQEVIDNGIYTNQGIPFKIFGNSVAPTGPGFAKTPSPYDGSVIATYPNVTLTWTNPNEATSNQVWFGPHPDSLSLIHSGSLVNSKGVTSLSPYKVYFWRVDEIGTEGTTQGTLWAFRTIAGPQTLPYNQNFDDVFFPPQYWTSLRGTNSNQWLRFTGTGVPYAGTAAMVYPFNPVYQADAWMITPGFNLTAGINYTVKFYQKVHNAGFPEKLRITVGNFPNISNQTTVLWSDTNLTTTAYTERLVSFTPTSSGTYYFGFNCFSNADRFYLYVDEVSIYETPNNDLGTVNLYESLGVMKEQIVNNNFSREIYEKSKVQSHSTGSGNLGITLIQKIDSDFSEVTPPVFKVVVKNFGNVTENSYQVGWAVDGINQSPVSNTQPLAPTQTDTLTLNWSSATAGLHSVKAWTILAGDGNPFNDTSNVYSFYVASDNSVFLEKFEGSFPPAGWDTVNVDGGGTTLWFKGNPTVFPALEGTGYAGSNFQGANGFYIDQWLITPNNGSLMEATDSLVFWLRSPDGSIWPDSLQILVSTTGNNIGDFTTVLDYIEAPIAGWARYAYALPNSANRYIAFRYLHYDGGPTGNSSNYIGLDLVEIVRYSTASTFQLTVSVGNGWNMVSVPGLHPVDQNILTWWPGKDPAANVFKFQGAYQSVTTVQPGLGYWMKHLGTNTYNTGDEWPAGGINIVAHDPLNAAAGWNLIGGYEFLAPTSALTTNPSGLISGFVYGYTTSGGYQVASDLVPGYGYWLKLTAAGQININPGPKANFKLSDFIPDDFGKIIITDNAGKSYTLYVAQGKQAQKTSLDFFELPPVAFPDMFDVRYTTGRFVEDLSSAMKTVQMQGVEYPVRVRVEGMMLRITDETGKAVNERVNSGEEITISNSQISKLNVMSDIIPDKYSLEQNYPNPFNPTTTIEFSLPEDVENVRLTIYNALGEKVSELVNGKMEAGRYRYQWNAGNVATGLYIYELRTNKFTLSRKMLLMK